MRRLLTASAIGLVIASSLMVEGRLRQGPGDDPIRMRTLRPGDVLYILVGGGGNALALAHDDGVVLIDTKLPGRGAEIAAAVQAVTDKPVTTIVNTHAHIDHTGGNSEFTSATTIVSHERARETMRQMPAFAGAGARFLPTRIVSDRMSLLSGPDRIELYYFGRGHTDGDLVVVFPEKRLAYFGDLFPAKAAPSVDRSSGGSAMALPQTLARAVSEITGVTQVVTGHREGLTVERDQKAASVDISTPRMMRWSDVQEYAEFTRDFVAAVQAAIVDGKSAAQAAATLRLPDKYKDYDMRSAAGAVEAIYSEAAK